MFMVGIYIHNWIDVNLYMIPFAPDKNFQFYTFSYFHSEFYGCSESKIVGNWYVQYIFVLVQYFFIPE